MNVLKRIIEESETPAGKAFDIFIQLLIVLSLISFSIETLPDLSERTKDTLQVIEIITVAIFTMEYLLRIVVADKRIKFIFSFYGIIDLAAILPFYIVSGIDLRSIRMLRLFRAMRVFKIFRYNQTVQRFKNAFLSIRQEMTLFVIATIFLLFIASVGIYYFEKDAQPETFKSIFHSLWWAVTTLTTVGYGDMHPVTIGGKIFTSFILIIGIGVIAIPTGLFASALTKDSNQNYSEDQEEEK